jgi:hypothetical protein
MRLETIDRGADLSIRDRARVARSITAALDRYEDRVHRVRVRLFRAGRRMVRCKIRTWFGPGPTIVVSSVCPTIGEAVDEAAETLRQAISRRRGQAGLARESRRRDRTAIESTGSEGST